MNKRNEKNKYDEPVELWRKDEPQNVSVWYLVGGVVVIGIAAFLIVAGSDIKRYIKISTM